MEGVRYEIEATGTQGASLEVGGWSAMEIGGTVPTGGPWVLFVASALLVTVGAAMAARRRIGGTS